MIKQLLLVFLLFAVSCKKDKQNPNGSEPPKPPPFLDEEPNNDVFTASLVTVKKFRGFCEGGNDIDFFFFPINEPQLVSFTLDYRSDVIMEAYIYVRNFLTGEVHLVKHKFGEYGHLYVLDEFIPVINYGYYLAFRPIINKLTEYSVIVYN